MLPRLLVLLMLCPALAWAQPSCAPPDDFTDTVRPLPIVAQALHRGTLRVLVLGSASITGPGGSAPERSWPARLEALLAALHPRAQIEMTVRGGRGVSVQDHLALLRQELANPAPHLVIWQAGTVEATRNMDPDEMTEALQDGLERIRALGADAILVDPQFSRFLRANANVEPYRDKLRLAAAGAGATLFRRWELMHHWIEAGVLDLERTPRDARMGAMDRLNDCLARAMTELITAGLR